MDYNTIAKALLLMVRNKDGVNVPFASLMPSYGPFESLEAVYADLINTFGEIGNVPRGYTFCVIENNKPQEYWLTKAGDWSSKEKKNVSSSSSTDIVSGLIIEKRGDYIQVSYDNGETWANLVALDDIKGRPGNTGSPGKDGKDATADLSKVQIRMTSKIVTEPDPDDPEETIKYTEYKIEYTVNGGINWLNVGTIKSGSGSGSGTEHVITIETWTDGNQYWKQDGNWMLDDNGNMVRANGKDGADGADGAGYSTQFKSIIFKRSNNTRIVNGVELLQESEYPEGGTYNHPVPPSGNWYDGVPAGTAKLWMSTRWFSTNEAITAANNWSVPSPATDTADLDIEYSNAPLEEMPLDPGPSKNRNMYNVSTNPNGWYDGDEHSELLQDANWMTMRTCKNGFWNAWKTFKIRGEQGENAIVPTVEFTSVVFRRSNNTRIVSGKVKLAASEYPEGGSYDSPVPTNRDSQDRLLWSDGLPVGHGELLWMSMRIFRSDGNNGEWEEPIQAADGVSGYDFEWCDDETPRYAYPTRTSPDDNESGKRQDDTWYDEPSQNSDPIWMAMRPYEGNIYTSPNWTVMRVKGERGTDGTSFVPKGQLFGIFDTIAQARTYYQANAASLGNQKYAIVGAGLTSLYEFSAQYPTGRLVTPLTIGDAYVNSGGAGKYDKTAGDLKEHVFIWDGDNFVDFGNIQGPPGEGTYFHIKYSNDGGNSFTFSGDVQDGETPGDYIGLRVDHVAADSMNPRDYIWSKFKGEDGFGYEYIFKLTNEEVAPLVPTIEKCHDYIADEGTQQQRTVTYQDDDYVPGFLGWTDDPGSPTKRYPYCWVAYRRKIDGLWQAYRGGSADSKRAALFSICTSNGRGIDHIDEMYALGTSGTTAPDLNDFGPSVPEFDFEHGLIYLWNYEIIHYDDDTTQTTDPECIAVSEKGRGIDTIQEFYYACAFGNSEANDLQTHLPQWGGPNRSAAWKTKPMNVDKTNPFLWNFELITYTDGTQSWTDPVIIAYYVYTNVEYLMTIFKKVEGNSDTAYLGGLVGVVERGSDNNDVLRAMLNATNLGSNEHGKLIIASGFRGYNDVNNATFKVYEDGHVEMHDALIQGFLQQYYKNQQNVEKDTYMMTLPGYERTIEIDRNKCGNYVMLAWQNLVVTGRFTLNLISSNVNPLYPGKIVFTNSMYIADNGSVYYNAYNNPTFISVNLLLPDGTLRKSAKIVLRNGWIEIGKVRSLSSNNEEVVPSLVDFQNVYMLYSWGGNVTFSYDTSFTPVVSNNSVITGYEQTPDNEINRFIDASASVARVHMQNKVVFINTSGVEDTLYIVMPFFYYIPDYQSTGMLGETDYAEPVTWLFEVETLHREIKFKYEPISANTPDEDVPDLPDLKVAFGNGVTDLVIPNTRNSGATPGKILFKITYYPGEGSVYGNWVVEKVTQVASID